MSFYPGSYLWNPLMLANPTLSKMYPMVKSPEQLIGQLYCGLNSLIDYTNQLSNYYIPQFKGEWDVSEKYNPNDLVVDSDGNTWVALKPVPAGTPLEESEYWHVAYQYSAQFNDLKETVQTFDERISKNAEDIAANAEDIAANTDAIGIVENDIARINRYSTAYYGGVIGFHLLGTANKPADYSVQSCCVNGNYMIVTGTYSPDVDNSKKVFYSTIDLLNDTQSFIEKEYDIMTHQNSITWNPVKNMYTICGITDSSAFIFETDTAFNIVNRYPKTKYYAVDSLNMTDWYGVRDAGNNASFYIDKMDSSYNIVESKHLNIPLGVFQTIKVLSTYTALLISSTAIYVYNLQDNVIIASYFRNEFDFEMESVAFYQNKMLICGNTSVANIGFAIYTASILNSSSDSNSYNSFTKMNGVAFTVNSDNTFYYDNRTSVIHTPSLPLKYIENSHITYNVDCNVEMRQMPRWVTVNDGVTLHMETPNENKTVTLDGSGTAYLDNGGSFILVGSIHAVVNGNNVYFINIAAQAVTLESTLASANVNITGTSIRLSATTQIFNGSLQNGQQVQYQASYETAITFVSSNTCMAVVTSTADGNDYSYVPLTPLNNSTLVGAASSGPGSGGGQTVVQITITQAGNILGSQIYKNGSPAYLRQLYVAP